MDAAANLVKREGYVKDAIPIGASMLARAEHPALAEFDLRLLAHGCFYFEEAARPADWDFEVEWGVSPSLMDRRRNSRCARSRSSSVCARSRASSVRSRSARLNVWGMAWGQWWFRANQPRRRSASIGSKSV